MSMMFDTEKFLREKGVVDEQGNALPGLESHVALHRALDVFEDTIVEAGTRELGVILELHRVMARTRFWHGREELHTDAAQSAILGSVFRFVRGLPE